MRSHSCGVQCSISAPEPIVPLGNPPVIDAARLAGTYAHLGAGMRVSIDGGRITMTAIHHPDAALGEPGKTEEFVLVPYSQSTSDVVLVTAQPMLGAHQPVMFPAVTVTAAGSAEQVSAESGSAEAPGYLRFGSRVFMRTGQ